MPLNRKQGKTSTTEQVFQAFHANFEKSRNVIDFIVGTMISKQRTLLSMDELESCAVEANCGFTRVEAYHLLAHGFRGLELDNHTIKFVPAALPEEYVAYHASLGNFLAKLGERNETEGVLNREELMRRMEMYASAWKPIRPFRGVVRPTEYVRQSDVLGAVFSSQRNLETVIAVIAAGKNVTLAALQRLFPDDSIMDEEDRHELRQFGILKETGKGWKINEREWSANIRLLAMHSLGMASALWRHLNPRGSLSRDEHLSVPGPVAHTLVFMPGARAFNLDKRTAPEPWQPSIDGGVAMPDMDGALRDEVSSGVLDASWRSDPRDPSTVAAVFQYSEASYDDVILSTPFDAIIPEMIVGSEQANSLVSIEELIVASDPVDLSDGSSESIDETLARAFTGDEIFILPDLDAEYFEGQEDESTSDDRAYDVHFSNPSVATFGYKPRKRPLKKAVFEAMKKLRNARRIENIRKTWEKKKARSYESIVTSANGVEAPPQERRYRQADNIMDSIRINGNDNYYPRENPYEEPTTALPGSEEKVEVLADRVRRGVPLWHPHDRIDLSTFDKDSENENRFMTRSRKQA